MKHLSVLPLIDWYTVGDELVGEPGVSYLVRADDTTIMFDVGLNKGNEHPSPLLRNMKTLGIDFSDIDAIFISHAHCDHLGGMSHPEMHTFAPSGVTAPPWGPTPTGTTVATVLEAVSITETV